jgi:WD40 repeat protein
VHQPVAGFTITPKASDGPVTVPVSTSRRFDARAEDASGNPVADVQVSFAVADTSIVQFSAATRTLSARRIGSTTLTARLDGFDPVVWTVNVIPVNVALDRGRVALRVGDRVQLAARLVDGDGAVVPGVTGPVTWTSARPAIASVANGAISAAALGHTLIRASTPWGTADSVEVFVNGDILISSDRAARGGVGVYEVRLAEPDVFVPVLADTSTNLHASYSPDRTRIAFSSNRSGTFDIWVMDADGSALTRVTSGPGAETEPVWTPDGKRIVYTASTGGQTQIASSGVDGSDPQTLTDTPGGNISPAVSPDGRIIAFASGRGGNYEIFEMGIDGTNVRRITATPQREQAPQFFSNGDLLYATDRPKGGSRIVRQSGSTLKVLAETDDAVLALALSPDGRRYIYLAGKQVERGGDRAEYRLVAQSTDGTSQVVIIPLRVGEQAATPSF